MAAVAVSVEGLRKHYGSLEAVAGVSFEVDRSEVFALLGPNGAGKTTTIEILEGFRTRDAGRVQVLGFDPAERRRDFRERLGIVLQELAVEPMLSVREVLERNAGYYPAPRGVDEVIELVGLGEKADARVKTLSGGQQRRLDVGLGIVGNPELVFLDEPTTGFDPSARRGAWDLVRALSGGGTTVILTTHYMDEAEALADRVAVIARGRIVAIGPPRSLGGRDVGEATIRFHLPEGAPRPELRVAARDGTGGVFEIATDDEVGVLHELTGWSLERHVPLQGLTVERLTLEDVYLRLVGDTAHGAPGAGDVGPPS
ncbi:MAG TPA: ABC transporter ATP-binding protein [Acidimicrobiales bacterium]|nr:ABC transporter ATP-binding protein [Acidimicrobiales bacterium]